MSLILKYFIRYGDTPSQFVYNYEFCNEQVIHFIGPCVYQRSFTNCCAENIICGTHLHLSTKLTLRKLWIFTEEKLIQSLHQCRFNDKIYHEGEFMHPTERCHTYKCLCDKDFNDAIEVSKNPKCQLIN